MAKFRIKTKDCQLIVKAKFSSNEKINETELDFFTRKYIRGLLKAKQTRKNLIEYTGPIGISLYERLKKPITKYDFFFYLEQLIDMTQKIRANSMRLSKLVLDLHYVFVNETTKEMQFLYLPLETEPTEYNVMEFIDSVIYSANPAESIDSNSISQFVYFLKGLKEYDAEKIERYIQKIDRSIVNTIKKHAVGQSGFMTDKLQHYYKHYESDDDSPTGLLEEDDEATGLLVEDEATGLLIEDEYEETAFLDENETALLVEDDEMEGTALLQEDLHFPSLYRTLTEETIYVNKPVFRLGKERSYADYFVSNNNAVSRSHADIITRGQRYYVVDLNSKNKTYINNQSIPVNQEIELNDGDILKLANEEFVFYV